MPLALTALPLTRTYREKLEASLGTRPEYLSLSQLRRMPVSDALRALRPHGANACFLPLEDAGARAVLPMVHAVAAISSARSIEIVNPDLTRERVSRWRILPLLAQMVAASADGYGVVRSCGEELDELLGRERISVRGSADQLLYVNPNLWFGVKAGGSVGHVAGVVNALAASGSTVSLASVSEPILVDPQIRYERLKPAAAFGLPLEVNYYRFQRAIVEQLALLARDRRTTMIYQRMSVANYAGPVLSRALSVPLVVEYNGSEVWAAKHWGRELRYDDLALRTELACLRHAHLVVTVSSVLREELLVRGVEEERIVCYPNCVDTDVYDSERFTPEARAELRARLGIDRDAVVATFVGTFGQWHGVDRLARTVRRLIDTDQSWLERHNVHFLLVGDGLKMPDVQELVGGERGHPFVTLTGLIPQEAAPAFLAASDVLLSPHVVNEDGTRFFGSPTKLFEYMAMGKAILASDLDQIGDVLRPALATDELPAGDPEPDETRLAVLAPPGNEAALELGLRFLVESSAWRRRLGADARAKALERYTWRHHVEAIHAGLRRASALA